MYMIAAFINVISLNAYGISKVMYVYFLTRKEIYSNEIPSPVPNTLFGG